MMLDVAFNSEKNKKQKRKKERKDQALANHTSVRTRREHGYIGIHELGLERIIYLLSKAPQPNPHSHTQCSTMAQDLLT